MLRLVYDTSLREIKTFVLNVFRLFIVKTIRKIGLANLFTRSLPIRMLAVGPSITLQWFFYDTIKVLCGL